MLISALSTFETGQFFSAVARQFLELRPLDARHVGASVRCDLLILKPSPSLSSDTAASVVSSVGCEARALKLEGERHGEAPGMGGGDQFFGIGALLVLEPRLERIRASKQNAGIGRVMPGAVLAGALPDCLCLAIMPSSPSSGWVALVPH